MCGMPERSRGFPTASPPSKKTTGARQDEARQSRAGNGTGNASESDALGASIDGRRRLMPSSRAISSSRGRATCVRTLPWAEFAIQFGARFPAR